MELLDLCCQSVIFDLVAPHNLGQLTFEFFEIGLLFLFFVLNFLEKPLEGFLYINRELLSLCEMKTFSDASSLSFQLSAKR